jgi:mono/diheme cytochrome c family protein
MLIRFTTRRILPGAAFAIVAGMMAAPLSAASQDAAQIKKGEQVYAAQKCSMCHSIAGKGNKQNPLDGIGAKLSADDIKLWITNPTEAAAKAKSTKKPPMPAKYGKLSPEDLDALVAYMASLK